jgi:tetratricopeptide (TPR) repeat protein
MFDKFLSSVKAKGFFEGTQEGTPAYAKRYDKVLAKFKSKYSSRSSATTDPMSDASAIDEAKANAQAVAEKLKQGGNDMMKVGEYREAKAFYDQAVDTCPTGPNSHIYYANRAAALMHLKDFHAAAADCSASIALKPDYAKAYSRLGQAQLASGDAAGSVASCKKAIELDPRASVAAKHTLKEALLLAPPAASSDGNASAGMGAGMGGIQEMLGKMAGNNDLPDFGALMNDPRISQVLNDPAMMAKVKSQMPTLPGGMDIGGMLNNPMVKQMLQNPQMMSMAQNMMQSNPELQSMMARKMWRSGRVM